MKLDEGLEEPPMPKETPLTCLQELMKALKVNS
jgi:hypothetical protein